MDDQTDYSNRLSFLHKVIEDTQGTIRFLDTKAAFCITLLTAMMAGASSLRGSHSSYPHAHLFFLAMFEVGALACVSICVRVIFPTIHNQGIFSGSGAGGPSFFLPISQRRSGWACLSDKPPSGLEASHAAYTASVMAATNADLVHSLCDEVMTISYLRQAKSDRLHLAVQILSSTVVAFFLQLAI